MGGNIHQISLGIGKDFRRHGSWNVLRLKKTHDELTRMGPIQKFILFVVFLQEEN